MGKRRRRRADPTDDWEQLELLCAWEEQKEYERIRPLVLFGGSVPERAAQTGTSERTLYRRIAGFEEDGMESLFATRHRPPQLKLFALEDALGDTGWLKALALDGYAAGARSKPEISQGVLFSYPEAL